MSLVGELDLMLMQVTSFLRVYWQISPWYLVGLEMKGVELAPGVKEDLLSAQWL